MSSNEVSGLNFFVFDKNSGSSYEEIASAQIEQTGGSATDAEVQALAQHLQELNNNKELKEGEQIFVPLEYAIDEIQANIQTTQSEVTKKQGEVSKAQSDLSQASGDVAAKLSAYNEIMGKSTTKQVKNKEGKVETVTDDAVVAAQKQAKEAYDNAVTTEKDKKTALENAKKELTAANEEVEKQSKELEQAKKDLKEEKDLSDKEIKEIEGQIDETKQQLEKAKAQAEQEQQNMQPEIDATMEAANQNQKIASDLGDSPNEEELKKAMNNTISSIDYVPTSDGKKRQIIKYADGSTGENNQHEGVDKNGNKISYYGDVKKDENGNILLDINGNPIYETDQNGFLINQANFDNRGDALYGGDIEKYQGTKTKYVSNGNNKPNFEKTESGYIYDNASNGTISLSNPDEAIVEIRKDENGKDVTYIAGAKDLIVKTSENGNDINIIVEDSNIFTIDSTGKHNNNIEISNSKFFQSSSGRAGDQRGILTDSGNDNIKIKDTTFEEGTYLSTRHGDDTINISNSTVDSIKSENGSDAIIVEDSTVNNIETGSDADTIIMKNSSAKTIDGEDNEDGVVLYDNATADDVKNSETKAYNIDSSGYHFDNTDYVNAKSIMQKQGLSLKEAEDAADANAEEAQTASNSIIEKYFGKNAKVTPEQEVQAAYLNYLETNNNALKTQLENQNDNDGVVAEGYNNIKKFLDAGITDTYIENAIAEQEEANEELKKAMLGKSDKYSSFEEAYKDITGVEYDEDRVSNYIQTYSNYQLATTGLAKVNSYEERLANAENMKDVVDVFTEYYKGDENKAVEEINKYIKEGNAGGREDSRIYDVDIVEKYVDGVKSYEIVAKADEGNGTGIGFNYESMTNKDGKITLYASLEQTPNFFKKTKFEGTSHMEHNPFKTQFEGNFEKSMGISVSDLQEQFAEEQLAAVGKNTAVQRMLDQYCEDQNGIEKKVSEVLTKAGMITTIGGAVVSTFCPPAGYAMMKVGGWTMKAGMFGDEVLGAIDHMTSNNASLEGLAQYGGQFATDMALYWSGRGIGQISSAFGEMAGSAVAEYGGSMLTQKVAQYGTEAVSDGIMSLAADYLITGEVDITGEGFNQMMGIWTGIANSKIQQHASKVANDAFARHPDDPVAAATAMKEAGLTNKQISSVCENFYYDKSYSEKLAGIDSVATNPFEGKGNTAHIYETVFAKDPETAYKQYSKLVKKGIIKNDTLGKKIDGFKNSKMDIQVESDINKLYEAQQSGISTKDAFIPKFNSDSDAIPKMQVGDVCRIGDSEMVSIKQKDGSIKELKLSADKYLELFPPVERYSYGQEAIGDCYLVSASNALYKNPNTRSSVLECYAENPDGSVSVQVPNGKAAVTLQPGQKTEDLMNSGHYHKKIYNKDGTISIDSTKTLGEDSSAKALVNGCEGMKMFEYAYGVTLVTERIISMNNAISLDRVAANDAQKRVLVIETMLNNPDKTYTISELQSELSSKYGKSYDFSTRYINNLRSINGISVQGDKIFIQDKTNALGERQNSINRSMEMTKKAKEIDNELTKFAGTDGIEQTMRNGGFGSDVVRRFNIGITERYHGNGQKGEMGSISNTSGMSDFIKTKLEKAAGSNANNYVIVAGTLSGESHNDAIDKPNSIYYSHEYTIKPIMNGGSLEIVVTNPWNNGLVAVLTYDEFAKYFNGVSITKLA